MKQPTDLLLNAEGDLLLVNGDVAAGNAATDNQRLLLTIEKAELRYAPFDVVGVREYLNDESPRTMLREIRRVFALDGMRIDTMTFVNGSLKIDAPYV